ncbi:NAD(P)-dependent oxidoreductase [Desulfococcaceae bacterium HSG7]|nr:NAD(P)-dependent oxidoreductase [Desulfococcaceae bacterium HSG7]
MTTPTPRPRVLICNSIASPGEAMLKRYFDVEVRSKADEAELLADIEDFHAIVVNCDVRISAQMIDRAERLKVIGRTGIKCGEIDGRAAKAKGIVVLSSPDAVAIAVAEHTMALLLALVRHIPEANRALADGRCNRVRNAAQPFMGVSLIGKTLGIVGFGRIGKEVAQRASAFGMKVIVNMRRNTSVLNDYKDIDAVSLDALFTRADFISLHVSQNVANTRMIGANQFALMKPEAYLINTSSETVIDEDALLEALNQGRMAGVGLDVIKNVADADNKLTHHPKVLATPNIGACTLDARKMASTTIAQQIIDLLQKSRLNNPLAIQVVAMEDVFPHENIDPRRVARLSEKIKSATVMTNPPIVVASDGQYIVLDGATRTTAFRQLGYPHIIVQVFAEEDDKLGLDTWRHAIRQIEPEKLVHILDSIPEISMIASQPETVLQEMTDYGGLCYLTTVENKTFHIKPAPGVNHLDALNKLTNTYIEASYVTRSIENDINLVAEEHPDLAALVIFPKYEIEQVLQIARARRALPAGITRFLIPGRVMRLNADLAMLKSSQSLSEKNEWLYELTMKKLADDQVRYYQEPVYLLDE